MNGKYVVIGLAIVLFGAALGWGIWRKVSHSHHRSQQAAEEPAEETPMPREALITLTTEWSRPVFLHRGEHLECHVLTPDAWWVLRLNGEKEYTFTPINFPGSSFRELPDIGGTVEWRLLTGHVTQAKLTYKVTKKS